MKPLPMRQFGLTMVMASMTLLLYAQTDFVGSGGSVETPAGSVSFTVGQSFSQVTDMAQGAVYEGVQQPFELFVVSIFSGPAQTLHARVFPNPASTDLNIQLETEQVISETTLVLSDINGRSVTSDSFAGKDMLLPVANIPPGTYFLSLFQEGKAVSIFKITKQ